METSPCCNSVVGHQIATNFCTCHDSTAVVPCTKFCSYHCIKIEMRVKRNFHRIWIAMEKPLVKRGPGYASQHCWCLCLAHEVVITWKSFPYYWALCQENPRSPPRGFLSQRSSNAENVCMFSTLLTWTSCWTTNQFVGDLRPQEAHVTSL